MRGSLCPHVCDGRAGQQRRLSNDLDNPWRGRQKRLHEVHEVRLDLFALSIEELASTLLLETLESRDMCAEDELVDGLHKVLVQLLALLLLLGPVVGVGLCVDAVDLLVVLDKGVNSLDGELVGDLVAQDHVDVDDVGLDVDELVAEEVLHGVLGHLGLGQLGKH